MRYASLNIFQVLLGDCIDCIAALVRLVRDPNDFPDVSQRKAEVSAVPYKLQPPEMIGAISALIARCPWRLWQQAFLFIMTNNLDRTAALVGKLSNRK